MSELSEDLFDAGIAMAKTLARSEDPETSKDAAIKMVESGVLNQQEQEVYKAIVEYVEKNTHVCNPKGFTTKSIAISMSEFRRYADYYKWYDICRKRFSGLENKGKIKLTGARRDGCRVWRII